MFYSAGTQVGAPQVGAPQVEFDDEFVLVSTSDTVVSRGDEFTIAVGLHSPSPIHAKRIFCNSATIGFYDRNLRTIRWISHQADIYAPYNSGLGFVGGAIVLGGGNEDQRKKVTLESSRLGAHLIWVTVVGTRENEPNSEIELRSRPIIVTTLPSEINGEIDESCIWDERFRTFVSEDTQLEYERLK